MQRQNRSHDKERRGDTSRTSNQGRKLSSGGDVNSDKRGNPEMDDNAKSVKTELEVRSKSRPRKS